MHHRSRRPIGLLALAIAIVAAVSAVGSPASADLPPGASTNSYGDIVNYTHPMLFPIQVPKAEIQATFRWPRGTSRTHEGIDIIAPKMAPLVAVANGTISFITIPEAAWGYSLRLRADDGWTYAYLHINNDTPGTTDNRAPMEYVFAPGISLGARVTAGQVLGWVGDSGYASGPHLHFEMRSPTGQLTDPAPSVKAAYANRGATPTTVPGTPTTVPTATTVPGTPTTVPASTAPASTTTTTRPATTTTAPPPVAMPPLSPTAAPDPVSLPMRMAGLDRAQTAVIASNFGWPTGSSEVVLVDGTRFAEALPASVLAARRAAPVLIATNGVDDVLRVELDRLGASRVWVVGSVPTSVDQTLTASGRTVQRIGVAGDPVATAAAIARSIGSTDGTFVLVNKDRFADAIAAAGLAAQRGWPILLTETSRIPQPTVDAWRVIGARRTVVMGGTAVIGDNVARFAPSSTRLAGSNRFETSAAAVNEFLRLGARRDHVLVVTGAGFADAIASGALSARLNVPTVLVDGSGAGGDPHSQMLLGAMAGATTPHLFGGTAAIADTAEQRILLLLGR